MPEASSYRTAIRRDLPQIVAIYKTRQHDERQFFSRWEQVLAEAERHLGK